MLALAVNIFYYSCNILGNIKNKISIFSYIKNKKKYFGCRIYQNIRNNKKLFLIFDEFFYNIRINRLIKYEFKSFKIKFISYLSHIYIYSSSGKFYLKRLQHLISPETYTKFLYLYL